MSKETLGVTVGLVGSRAQSKILLKNILPSGLYVIDYVTMTEHFWNFNRFTKITMLIRTLNLINPKKLKTIQRQ